MREDSIEPSEDELVEVAVEDGENEWVWLSELLDIIAQADTIEVFEEHFEKAGMMFGVEVDDDGYLRREETGEYVTPHTPMVVGESVEFMPIEEVADETSSFGFRDVTLRERMERTDSSPEKLHVSDVYGIAMYAGDPVFLYNEFHSGLAMDASEWEPMVKVRPLHEYECDLCGHEYTNRDFEVPEDASMYWTHSCPECNKAVDRTVELVIGMEETRLKDAHSIATEIQNRISS